MGGRGESGVKEGMVVDEGVKFVREEQIGGVLLEIYEEKCREGGEKAD